jgi:membrane protein implicated in regulation of membrane protease activity
VNTNPRFDTARAFLWTLVGAVVLLGVFFFVLGGLEPAQAEVLAIVLVVLAALWLLHFWRNRRVATDIRLQRGDRERRGF